MWEGEILTTESFSLRSPPFRPAELQRRRVGEAGTEDTEFSCRAGIPLGGDKQASCMCTGKPMPASCETVAGGKLLPYPLCRFGLEGYSHLTQVSASVYNLVQIIPVVQAPGHGAFFRHFLDEVIGLASVDSLRDQAFLAEVAPRFSLYLVLDLVLQNLCALP